MSIYYFSTLFIDSHFFITWSESYQCNLFFLSNCVFSYFSFKNNTSFVSRFNTLRRGRSGHNPAAHKLQAANASNDNLNACSAGTNGNGTGVTTDQPPLSREASIKKGSDGKTLFFIFVPFSLEKCLQLYFKGAATLKQVWKNFGAPISFYTNIVLLFPIAVLLDLLDASFYSHFLAFCFG